MGVSAGVAALPPMERAKHAPDWISHQRRFWMRAIWITLAEVLIPVHVGFGTTVFLMARTIQQVSENGARDSSAFAREVTSVWRPALLGFTISLFFLVALFFAVARYCGLLRVAPPLVSRVR